VADREEKVGALAGNGAGLAQQSVARQVDASWGRSGSDSRGVTVRGRVAGDVLTLTYITVFNAASDRDMVQQKKAQTEAGERYLALALAGVKKGCLEADGVRVRFEPLGGGQADVRLDLVDASRYNPKKTAMVRVGLSWTIS
jgi:hypothetical protein